MRAVRRLLALLALGLAVVVATAGGASAHPLGNFTINTYDGIVVVPGEVRVNYVLDMAEIPTFQLGRSLDTNGDGTASPAELVAFAHVKSHDLLPSVHVARDGRPVPLAVRSATAILRPGQAGLHILRMEVVYAGPVARTGTLTLEDRTYADHIGWHEITAVGARGAVLARSNVPTRTISDALLRYPKNLLASPLHVTSARLSFRPGASGAAPTVPNGALGGLRPGITGGAFARLATWTGLSVPALLLALLLAAGFGAAHALLPGHGKTLIAAYLVGQGGRLRQAAQVGGGGGVHAFGLGAGAGDGDPGAAGHRARPHLPMGHAGDRAPGDRDGVGARRDPDPRRATGFRRTWPSSPRARPARPTVSEEVQ